MVSTEPGNDDRQPSVLVTHQYVDVTPEAQDLLGKIDKLNKKRIMALSHVTAARQLFNRWRNFQQRETRAFYDSALTTLDKAMNELTGELIGDIPSGVVPNENTRD